MWQSKRPRARFRSSCTHNGSVQAQTERIKTIWGARNAPKSPRTLDTYGFRTGAAPVTDPYENKLRHRWSNNYHTTPIIMPADHPTCQHGLLCPSCGMSISSCPTPNQSIAKIRDKTLHNAEHLRDVTCVVWTPITHPQIPVVYCVDAVPCLNSQRVIVDVPQKSPFKSVQY